MAALTERAMDIGAVVGVRLGLGMSQDEERFQ